jgi:hypothetical protein
LSPSFLFEIKIIVLHELFMKSVQSIFLQDIAGGDARAPGSYFIVFTFNFQLCSIFALIFLKSSRNPGYVTVAASMPRTVVSPAAASPATVKAMAMR